MKTQLQCLNVVVHRVLVDPTPHGSSPPMVQQAPFDPPLPHLDMDVEAVPNVPDAQSTPNEVNISQAVGDDCRNHDIVADSLGDPVDTESSQ